MSARQGIPKECPGSVTRLQCQEAATICARNGFRVPLVPFGCAECTVARKLCVAKFVVGRGGLEPPTSRLSGVRSNHLSYRPIRAVARVLV